jgi:hypothetical protein
VSKRSTFPPGCLPSLAHEPGDIRTGHADRLSRKATEHGMSRRRFP